jgi:transposase-like protein
MLSITGFSKEVRDMARKHFTAEQIIGKLREAEILLSQGKTQEQAIRAIGVTGNTYYRWRKEYGGMKLDQAKRLKDLEAENMRLKRAVAELTVDNQILKEVSKGKF